MRVFYMRVIKVELKIDDRITISKIDGKKM